MSARTLPVESLTWRLPDSALQFETTAEVKSLETFIGQDPALAAIRRAVAIQGPGFNVFVAGPRSTGRLGSIGRILTELQPPRRAARDFAYVRNFVDPARPRLLTFPPGRGLAFRKEVLRVAALLVEEVPRILNGDGIRTARDKLRQAAEVAQHKSMTALEAHAEELGFALAALDDGEGPGTPAVLWKAPPLDDEDEEDEDEPRLLSRAELQVIADAEGLELPIPHEKLVADWDILEAELAAAVDVSRTALLAALRSVGAAEAEAVRGGVTPIIKELGRKWPGSRGWLAELLDELVECPEWFDAEEPDHQALFAAFAVNLVHLGQKSRRAPIVSVTSPTWAQLLGGVEGEPGAIDHRSIRTGALLDADGGWLLLNAADVLQEPGVWKVLKRALVSGEVDIQNPEGPGAGAMGLRPDPLPIEVKVIVAGEPGVFAALYYGDPDFRNLFKIKAEFEEDAGITPEVIDDYARFCTRVIKSEGQPPYTRNALGRVLRWSVRESGRGGRITTQMGTIADLLRESACEAQVERSETVHSRHVEAALAARRYRDGLAERRTLELIQAGVVQLAVQGAAVGRINALVVYHLGGLDFGRPMRITATVGVGKAGVASLEREVGLSGKSHDKGVQILTGWLRSHLGQVRTFAFNASLTFEQSYGRIDGDSASSTELYVLLSALSGLPIDQGIAVTGSVNQFGEIQSVGGINEKIEGFYATCVALGLTGDQGVIIPASNVVDLCLDDAVVEACAAGRFRVWAVGDVAEGVELLMKAPIATVLARCGETLDRFQDIARLQGRKERPPSAT
ncbi:ATP-dependent protease [Deltaproteobacteria bacterium]|nr:ATP-dependent protease [Deltaproteobacteria bacterium]